MRERINRLRQRAAAVLVLAEELSNVAQAANRSLTTEELAQFDGHMAEHDSALAEIQRLERLETAREAGTQSRGAVVSATSPAGAGAAAGTGGAHVVEEPGDRPWRSFGEFLVAVRMATDRHRDNWDPRLIRAASGMSESVPSDGGFAVQKDFVTSLLTRTNETAILSQRCRRIPISTNANGIKINAVDETSRANGSRWGGVQVYWADEADTVTATKPKFRQMELTLKKLMGLCYATDELLQDAAALEAVALQAFSEEFAFKIDDGVFRGSGAGQMLGFMNSGALVTVSAEGGQTADTIVFENIIKMWARLWSRSKLNSVWLINTEIEPQLARMKFDIAATSPVPVYLPAGNIAGSPYSTLYGRPLIPIEHAAGLGDLGDISLVDLSQYLIAEKGGVQQASSIHVRFVNDELTYRFTLRIDGQPIWNRPLTPYKGTNTLSPFVTLAAR